MVGQTWWQRRGQKTQENFSSILTLGSGRGDKGRKRQSLPKIQIWRSPEENPLRRRIGKIQGRSRIPLLEKGAPGEPKGSPPRGGFVLLRDWGSEFLERQNFPYPPDRFLFPPVSQVVREIENRLPSGGKKHRASGRSVSLLDQIAKTLKKKLRRKNRAKVLFGS
jgi:hypothetical protein